MRINFLLESQTLARPVFPSTMMMSVSLSCPGPGPNCSDGSAIDIGKIPTYFSIASCSVSVLGSLLIIFSYAAFKDIRKGAQTLITLLALSDLVTTSGYLVAALNFLLFYTDDRGKRCEIFHDICEIQSFVTTWSSLCSFGWTIALALYFYLLLVRRRGRLALKLVQYEVVLIWGGPILVVLPLLVTNKLGFSSYTTANWCFVKEAENKELKHTPIALVCMLLGGKLWEAISYVVVAVLFTITRLRFKEQRAHLMAYRCQDREHFRQEEVQKRLLCIPIVFIVFRIWGTVQFIYSIVLHRRSPAACISNLNHGILSFLGVMQAIGDGGQGWGNTILYVVMSSSMRKRLFSDPYKKLKGFIGKRLKFITEKITGNAQETTEIIVPQTSSHTVTIVTMTHGSNEMQDPECPAREAHVVQTITTVVQPTTDLGSSAPLPTHLSRSDEKTKAGSHQRACYGTMTIDGSEDEEESSRLMRGYSSIPESDDNKPELCSPDFLSQKSLQEITQFEN